MAKMGIKMVKISVLRSRVSSSNSFRYMVHMRSCSLVDDADEGVVQIVAATQVAQFLDRAIEGGRAAVDDADAVAQFFHFVQVVGGKDQRHAQRLVAGYEI